MRTSCIEGVAIHGDLGSCAGVREDAGEALTEGEAGRQHRWPRYRERPADPARSKSLCMR